MTKLDYNPASVQRALNVHTTRGLIKDWNFAPLADDTRALYRTRYVADLNNGDRLELRTLREAYVFVCGLASANQGLTRTYEDAVRERDDALMFIEEHGETQGYRDYLTAKVSQINFERASYQVRALADGPRQPTKEIPMTTKIKTRKSTDQRRAEMQALRDRYAEFEKELDEGRVAMITAMHDGYSDRNACLIAMQMPEATDVSGFQAWRGRGRCVRKGEHGIAILAPAGHRDAVEATDETPAEDERQFFRMAYVFDVSQTDAIEALPALDHSFMEDDS